MLTSNLITNRNNLTNISRNLPNWEYQPLLLNLQASQLSNLGALRELSSVLYSKVIFKRILNLLNFPKPVKWKAWEGFVSKINLRKMRRRKNEKNRVEVVLPRFSSSKLEPSGAMEKKSKLGKIFDFLYKFFSSLNYWSKRILVIMDAMAPAEI